MTSQKRFQDMEEAGCFKQASHQSYGDNTVLGIQNALIELYSLSTTPVVILNGISAERYKKDKSLNTFNPQEIEVKSCFVSPEAEKIWSELYSLRTSFQLSELGDTLTLFPYSVQKSQQHKPQNSVNTLKSQRGLTATQQDVKVHTKLERR